MNDLARSLSEDEHTLVETILRCMLAERPDMYAKYSDAGPARTREDVAFHLRHLSGALTAGDPLIFQAYYNWLLGVLLPRGITQEDIDLNFDCMTRVLRKTYGERAEPGLRYIEQAVASRDTASSPHNDA